MQLHFVDSLVFGAVTRAVKKCGNCEQHTKRGAVDPGHQILARAVRALEELYDCKHGGYYPNTMSDNVSHLLDLCKGVDINNYVYNMCVYNTTYLCGLVGTAGLGFCILPLNTAQL